MIPPNQRSAAAALDTARPVIARLAVTSHPDDVAADLIESWTAVETALRSLIGGSALTGQTLVSEVRQRGMLDYGHAHALLGFLAARDRVARTDYRPTEMDTDAARAGFQAIEAALDSGAGDTSTGAARAAGGIGVPPSLAPSSPPPRAAATTSFGPPPAARPATAAPAAPPVAYEEVVAPRRSMLPMILGLVVVLALAAGGYWFWSSRTSSLDAGIAAFVSGNRVAARRDFEQAATDQPKLALPHVYLGRMARSDGDLPRAFGELRTAVTLEPTNPLALREMGQYLLQANQPAQAVTWFKRTLEADPTDRVAQGWMGCALSRQGQADVASRFFQRAGNGDWTACQQAAPLPGPAATPQPTGTPAVRTP